MIVLKVIREDGAESVRELGQDYKYIDRERCPSEFDKCSDVIWGEIRPGDCFGIVSTEGGQLIPLHSRCNYLTMSQGEVVEALMPVEGCV